VTCTRPLRGYRAPGGQVVFSASRGWVDRPVTVSCGQCMSCRLKRAQSWALRCVHEASLHDRNCFVTLTYDQEHLPFDGGLDVSHWQRFAKRVRKNVGPFRFLHCGEYGERNLRPHYHACIFGLDFRADRELFSRKANYDIFVSPTLTQQWGQGFCTLGDLTFQSAGYVARYVLKKVGGDLADEHYRRVDVETGEEFVVKREYCTMSRRPGLGAGWLDKFSDDVYPADFVVHDGKKYRPPVFYDRELEKQDSAFLEGVKRERVRKAAKYADDQTPDRLRVREVCTDARLSQFSRDV